MDETMFRDQALEEGYAEPVVLEYEPDKVIDTHTHDFAASLLILSGKITVTREDGATSCNTGDTFRLAKGVPHSEKAGPEGVRFLVARKH